MLPFRSCRCQIRIRIVENRVRVELFCCHVACMNSTTNNLVSQAGVINDQRPLHNIEHVTTAWRAQHRNYGSLFRTGSNNCDGNDQISLARPDFLQDFSAITHFFLCAHLLSKYYDNGNPNSLSCSPPSTCFTQS